MTINPFKDNIRALKFLCCIIGINMNKKFNEKLNNFCERLKFARKKADLRQSDLGQKVNLSQSTINRLERGVAKGTTKLIEIADVLNVSPEWLSTGELTSQIRIEVQPQINCRFTGINYGYPHFMGGN